MIDLSSSSSPAPPAAAEPSTTHQLPDWEGQPSSKKSGFFNNLFSSHSTSKPAAPPLYTLKNEDTEPSSEIPSTTQIAAFKPSISDRFNRVFPANRTYLGRSRRTAILCALGLLLLLILALGLGLGLGLKHNGSSGNLPLPSNGGIFTGDLTYYSPGLGACGITSSSTDAICAVSHILFDAASTGSNPNDNPLCGKMIRIERYDEAKGGNRSVDVKVVDRCVGCKVDDLDLSLSMFDDLAEESQGRVTGSWAWLS